MKQYYEALFLSYRPRTTECSISQYCDTNGYSGRSKHAWALAVNRWKKFQNHLYGQPVLTFTVLAVASVWMNINRVTLQHNKEFIMFIFYFKTVYIKVARYSFSGPIPPKFEHKLRGHKQSFEKIDTTVVLGKDENLVWSGLQRHRSCHSNEMTLLPILLDL